MEKLLRAAIAFFAIFGLLLIGAQVFPVVKAQPPVTLPVITILSDGSIQGAPIPSPIVNEGKIYQINENISGFGLDIQCSSILLLGEGNTLQATALYNTNSGIMIQANGVTVENVSIAAFYVGIDIQGSSDTVTESNITAYDNGITVFGYYNLITENQISECGASGIELSTSRSNVTSNTIKCPITVDEASSYDTINGNLLNGSTFDIEMYGYSNTVIDNTITGGSHGIIFYDPADANTVSKNNIANNYEGIGLDKEANYFYLNNLINNTYDVRLHIFSDPYVPYSMNVFDNGSVGNYWSDYTAKYPNATEKGNTGIYNTSYVIVGNIADKYPLTSPYTGTPPKITMLSQQNKSYTTIAEVPIEFTANKPLSTITYSLDGANNTTVNGNFTLPNLPIGYHNVTVYVTDVDGNTASQTLNFTVEKPQTEALGNALIPVVVAVPVAIACIGIGIGLLIYRRHRKQVKKNLT